MELTAHKTKINTSFDRWKRAEQERALDAGETREEIGAFLELTGLNKKAVSICRSLDKLGEEKRQDAMRSLRALLPIMEERWGEAGTPDMLEGAVDALGPDEEIDDEYDPNIDPPDDGEEDEDDEDEDAEQDDEIAEEAAEFDDAVDALDDDEEDEKPSNVRKIA